MTKKEFRQTYNISATTLRKLLNERYYDELKNVGYIKHDNYLSPSVVRKFFDLYGKPIINTEQNEY